MSHHVELTEMVQYKESLTTFLHIPQPRRIENYTGGSGSRTTSGSEMDVSGDGNQNISRHGSRVDNADGMRYCDYERRVMRFFSNFFLTFL